MEGGILICMFLVIIIWYDKWMFLLILFFDKNGIFVGFGVLC